MYNTIILNKGLCGCNVSMCREGSGRFGVNQWHRGLGDGGIYGMDMAGSVLGASPSLTWRWSDIVVVVNDGRSRCCEFWCAVGGGHGGCINGWDCIASGSQV